MMKSPNAASFAKIWEEFDTRKRSILELRAEGFTLQDVADELGVTRERVRQLEQQGRTQLLLDAHSAFPNITESLAQVEGGPVLAQIGEVAQLLTTESYTATAAMLVALGYRNCRVWGRKLPDWFELEPGHLGLLLAKVAAHAPFYDEDIMDVLEQHSVPGCIPVRKLLSAPSSPLLQDVNDFWIRRANKNCDSANLWLRMVSEPRSIEDICAGIGAVSTRALSELFRRNSDIFVQIRPEGTWALVDWNNVSVVAEYKDATEAVVDVLRDGGPMSQRQLTAETLRRYPVSASRVTQCLSSFLVGITEAGQLDLTERGAVLLTPKEPRQPSYAARSGTVVAVKVVVTKDVFRGSGIGVTPWLTWQLGLHHYPDSLDFAGDFPMTVRRQSSGSAVSTLREPAMALGLQLGCSMAVLLNAQDQTVSIRHGCVETCAAVEMAPHS